MPLPTLKNAKEYLRLTTTAEDSIVAQLLVRAQAIVETDIGVQLVAAADSLLDDTTRSQRAYSAPTRLQLDRYPIDPSGLVVTDTNGVVVDATTYRIDGRAGQIIGNVGMSFGSGPYTITGNVGLSAHPDYAARLEPLAGAAILDVVADLYQRRNPDASMESAGGGVSVQYHGDEIAPRTRALISRLRRMSGIA
jgi:hypothetical protein